MDANNILVSEFQNVLRIPEYNFNEVKWELNTKANSYDKLSLEHSVQHWQ